MQNPTRLPLYAVRRSARHAREGMTLVEIMVVIAIIVTLMSILGFGVFQIFNNSKVSTTQLQMREVDKNIQLYAVKKGVPDTSEGLATVYGGQRVPTDSWGNDFVYVKPGPAGRDYDLVSLGSDKAEGGEGNAADLKLSEM